MIAQNSQVDFDTVAASGVRVALGNAWLSSIGLIQVLSVWGITRVIRATAGPVFRALGLPRLNARLLFFCMLIMLILLNFPLGQMGGELWVLPQRCW